jgi:hypothetical protein
MVRMAIEAPYSKFKLNNYLIYIVVCIVAGGWFAYDGYLNEGYIKKHTKNYGTEEAVADSNLVGNRRLPFVLGAAALGFTILRFKRKGCKVVADDNGVTISGKTIAYDSIESINKTNFDSKGFFTVTYKDAGDTECEQKFSDRSFDKMPAILDHIVAKIS